jgi:hypothetical protein
VSPGAATTGATALANSDRAMNPDATIFMIISLLFADDRLLDSLDMEPSGRM